MRRKGFLFILVLVISTGVVFAQDNTPPLGTIGSFEASNFRALAVTADGDRLLVADAENNQVRIYDFSNPAQPTLQSSLDVSGTPMLLAGGANYGLAAVTTDTGDTLEAVAPALPAPNAEYVSGWANIDIGRNPHALALSPDSHWGVIVSEAGYTLLQIDGVGDIGSIPVDETIIDAALSNSTAYLLRGQTLEAAPLDRLAAMTSNKTLDLDGTPTTLALNAAVSAGAIVLDDTRIVLFDPATLKKTGEFTVEGTPISSIHFLSSSGKQYLIVAQQNSPTITVLNTADPQHINMLDGGLSLDKPVTALIVFGQYVIATDGVTIRIFST